MLGGACTYISLAASFFTKPHIVAVVGDDFAQEDYDFLIRRGIDLEGLERVPGKSFFWAGVYSHDMNERETLTTELNVFADFSPKLPESYRSKPYLLLGNIQPALQQQVRSQMNVDPTGRRRHHELLDLGLPQRIARHYRAVGFPAHQRQRGQDALGRK